LFYYSGHGGQPHRTSRYTKYIPGALVTLKRNEDESNAHFLEGIRRDSRETEWEYFQRKCEGRNVEGEIRKVYSKNDIYHCGGKFDKADVKWNDMNRARGPALKKHQLGHLLLNDDRKETEGMICTNDKPFPAYKLAKLFKDALENKRVKALVIMDACYSGRFMNLPHRCVEPVGKKSEINFTSAAKSEYRVRIDEPGMMIYLSGCRSDTTCLASSAGSYLTQAVIKHFKGETTLGEFYKESFLFVQGKMKRARSEAKPQLRCSKRVGLNQTMAELLGLTDKEARSSKTWNGGFIELPVPVQARGSGSRRRKLQGG